MPPAPPPPPCVTRRRPCTCVLTDHSWAREFTRARQELASAETVATATACLARLRTIQSEFELAAKRTAEVVVRQLYQPDNRRALPQSVDVPVPVHVVGGLVVLVSNNGLGGDEASIKFEVRETVGAVLCCACLL